MEDFQTTATASLQDGRLLLADRATDYIRHLIALRRLGPGDRVNEVDIASQLQISRGPVREAIRRLCSTGLLVGERNFGSRVVRLDEASVQRLYEVREALEAMAARLSAERMTQSEKRALVVMLGEHEAAIADGSSDAYPAGSTDWDFHLAILRGARNEIAWRICGHDLRDLISLVRSRHGTMQGRGKRALQEHRRISEAIAEGDADLAGLLMAKHIRASRETLVALMRRNGEKAGPTDL